MQINRTYGQQHNLAIELNGRMEFVYNPDKEAWEKEIFNDVVQIEYEDYDMASAYLSEWAEIWKDYKLFLPGT